LLNWINIFIPLGAGWVTEYRVIYVYNGTWIKKKSFCIGILICLLFIWLCFCYFINCVASNCRMICEWYIDKDNCIRFCILKITMPFLISFQRQLNNSNSMEHIGGSCSVHSYCNTSNEWLLTVAWCILHHHNYYCCYTE
jgi:hypothetical protein